jgi:chromosome segregation ATPase
MNQLLTQRLKTKPDKPLAAIVMFGVSFRKRLLRLVKHVFRKYNSKEGEEKLWRRSGEERMLEQLIHSVESGLKDLGRRLLQPSAREQWLDEIDRLSLQLRQRCAELTSSQRELASVKRRLRDNPTAAALLRSRIETLLCNGQAEQAWSAALELDQLRQKLAADQETCPRLEQRCWSLHFQVRQLQRQLDRLLDQLSPP